MSRPLFTRFRLPLAVAAALLVASVAAPAHAQPAESRSGGAAAASSNQVATLTDNLARQLARMLADPAIRTRITSAVAKGPVDLLTIEPQSGFGSAARAANVAVTTARGLPTTSGSLLQLRLAHPDMRAALDRGEVPLVLGGAFDDDAASVTAYSHRGEAVALDPSVLPAEPVLIVDVNNKKALSLGLDLIRGKLAEAGLSAPEVTRDHSGVATSSPTGYYATKIDEVYLAKDHEPDLKGAAEIFAIVAGFGLDGKPIVDIVDMPYLDHDKRTYYPNQILIHWRYDKYLYNIADVMMREDDGTNFGILANVLVAALSKISGIGGWKSLIEPILKAFDDYGLLIDDSDYVDSWYSLTTYSTGNHYGARGNGRMKLSSTWVDLLPPPPPGGGGPRCVPRSDGSFICPESTKLAPTLPYLP